MSAIIIQKSIHRCASSTIQLFADLPTPIISDSSETHCSMNCSIKPIACGMRVVGSAVTVQLGLNSNFLLHKALELAERGDVIVAQSGANVSRSAFGEIMATVAHKKEITGLVIDGFIRDVARCREIGFPIFARGAHPAVCGKEANAGTVNLPLRCGGIAVEPGDLVVGDDDGLVVVPRSRAHDVALQAQKTILGEESRLRDIEDGKLFPGWMNAAFAAIPIVYLDPTEEDKV